MIPALAARDCAAFGDSVYRYGRTAGGCFAAIQGGPYNGPHLTAIVDEIRGLGVNGVGQSSWGPTLFAVVADHEAADDLRCRLRARHAADRLDITVTAADNRGAVVTRHDA
jgi:predicted sugar kinase